MPLSTTEETDRAIDAAGQAYKTCGKTPVGRRGQPANISELQKYLRAYYCEGDITYVSTNTCRIRVNFLGPLQIYS